MKVSHSHGHYRNTVCSFSLSDFFSNGFSGWKHPQLVVGPGAALLYRVTDTTRCSYCFRTKPSAVLSPSLPLAFTVCIHWFLWPLKVSWQQEPGRWSLPLFPSDTLLQLSFLSKKSDYHLKEAQHCERQRGNEETAGSNYFKPLLFSVFDTF